MTGTMVAQPRKVVEVFFSDKSVTASEARSVIPAGFRQATVKEIALRYMHDYEFVRELYDNGPAWAADTGLRGSGHKEIGERGGFSPNNREDIFELSPQKRAHLSPGSGPVQVYADVLWAVGLRWLGVCADNPSSDVARVAYVKDTATPRNAAAKEAVRRE
jgi:hypothetical protein